MKVAIVGSAASTCDDAPWHDAGWQIWTLAWRTAPRADVLFEMHDRSAWDVHGGAGYTERLKQSPLPVYVPSPQSDVPSAKLYPSDDVVTAIPRCNFFTSSIAYMLALAILEGAEQIAIYGVDMLTEGEYAYQRPAIEYLIGFARGKGIEVTIPEKSSLCKANFIYGAAKAGEPVAQATGITEILLLARLQEYLAEQGREREKMNTGIVRMNTIDGGINEVKTLLELVRHYNRGGVIPQ